MYYDSATFPRGMRTTFHISPSVLASARLDIGSAAVIISRDQDRRWIAGGRGLRRRIALLTTVSVAVALLAVAVSRVSGPEPDPRPRLGLAGPFTASTLQAARRAGVTDVLIEVSWRSAEPAPGEFDDAFLGSIARRAHALREQGFRIALNTGVHDAPDWLLEMPGARFVDQFGNVYTEHPVPNLIFGTKYRLFAEAYLTHLLERLGTDFSVIRVGGGPLGELSYPYVADPQGHVQYRYWAFDPAALRESPVPGWRPGSPSPGGEAAAFLDWYLDSLVDYQNWQITAVRQAGYAGQVAVLYPSYGMRSGDAGRAVADDLAGTSPAELNGEVQRGYDFARQIRGLTDGNAVVYSTWGEQTPVVDYLAGLAREKGLAVMAENSGRNSQAAVDEALRTAARLHLAAFFLIRASDLGRAGNGSATFAGVATTYSSLG